MSHSFKQKEIRRNQKLTNIPRQALQDPEENGEAHLLLFISCSIENKTDTIHLKKGHERRKETEKVVRCSGAVRSYCPRDQISLIYLLSIKLVLLALGEDAKLRFQWLCMVSVSPFFQEARSTMLSPQRYIQSLW